MSAKTAATASSAAGLTACVAPKARAVASLTSDDVDRDDRGRTGVDGALHGVQPHAAGSDHDHRCPWLDAGGVDDGAEARDHAAGEQCGAVERKLRRDADHLGGVDDDLLGEGPRAEPLGDRASAGIGQRPRLVERERRVAEGRLAVGARRARATGADQRHDDVVAHEDSLHAGADLDDDPRRLVPEHRRQRASPRALEVVEVALADRAGGEPDPHLTAIGSCEPNVLDHERFAERAADGGSHRPEDTVEPDRCRTSVRLGSALDESGCDLS